MNKECVYIHITIHRGIPNLIHTHKVCIIYDISVLVFIVIFLIIVADFFWGNFETRNHGRVSIQHRGSAGDKRRRQAQETSAGDKRKKGENKRHLKKKKIPVHLEYSTACRNTPEYSGTACTAGRADNF